MDDCPLCLSLMAIPTLLAARAHDAIRRGIKKGTLVRPLACPECGTTTRRIEAAHHDYTRPMDFCWLCRSCHAKWDAVAPKGGLIATRAIDPTPKCNVELVRPTTQPKRLYCSQSCATLAQWERWRNGNGLPFGVAVGGVNGTPSS